MKKVKRPPITKRLKKKVATHPFTFLTNHAHVLICLAANPNVTLREVARIVGITERAILAIVKDLTLVKAVSIKKFGRRNQYRIHGEVHLRHMVERHRTVGDLLKAILAGS